MYSLNKTKFLDKIEINRLTRDLRGSSTRDAVMIEVALYTGARSQEVVNLKRKDLDLANSMIYIRGVKGSNDRELPISNYLLNRMKAILGVSQMSDSENLFPICTRRFRQIWESFKPCEKSLHSLRHTFAIELFARHRDIRLLQVTLGHRNINNTMIYSEYLYKKEELKKLLNFEFGQ